MDRQSSQDLDLALETRNRLPCTVHLGCLYVGFRCALNSVDSLIRCLTITFMLALPPLTVIIISSYYIQHNIFMYI